MSHQEEALHGGIFGVAASFDNPEDLLVAAEKAREAGYTKMDAYTPFPVHGLADAIGFRDNRVPWIIFIGGVLGAIGGYGLQYYVSVIDYPMNVGGRELNSWPQFIPVTFECTILFAALGAVFGMLALNGFPKPYDPMFNAPGFERASQDRFFLCIESDDPRFDPNDTMKFMQTLNAEQVTEVAR